MLGQFFLLLLPVIAAANITTTITVADVFSKPDERGRLDRVFGFRGSVVNVKKSTTTVLLHYDLDTYFGMGVRGESDSITATLAPSAVSLHEDARWWRYPIDWDMDCKRPSAATATTCIESFQGPGVNDINCERETRGDKTLHRTDYDWCSQTSVVPESITVSTHVLGPSNLQKYTIILNDGLEKLNGASAATTASGSESTAAPSTAASATAAAPQATNGAQSSRVQTCVLAVLGVILAAASI